MDIALVSELIDTQFPELAPAQVSFLGEGCDSTAFTVNGEWVFRFPKNEEVERQIEIEARILPQLARRLPVAIPQFRFRGAAAPGFGRRFAGYRKLRGEPAIRLSADDIHLEALSEPLGRVLSALHTFPVDAARRAGVPDAHVDALITEVRTDALENLPRVAEIAPDDPIDVWRAFIAAGVEAPGHSHVTLVHNDFAADHVLVDPDAAMTGVIDWGDIAVADPLVDFAGLFHWGGERLVRRVLDVYRGELDEAALRVARYLAACRGAGDIAFGLDRGAPAYVAAGLTALRMCVTTHNSEPRTQNSERKA